jgi:hypothetical protein
MTRDQRRQRLARLVHDVGKYVARTARNLPPPPAPVPAWAVAMLARDLYETAPPGRRASLLLDEISRGLDGVPEIDWARALLAEADALERDVRAADEAALRRAASIAREVELVLRAASRSAP